MSYCMLKYLQKYFKIQKTYFLYCRLSYLFNIKIVFCFVNINNNNFFIHYLYDVQFATYLLYLKILFLSIYIPCERKALN